MVDSVVYTDAFTYSDGDLALQPNWERHNSSRAASWQIVSNVASLQNSSQRDNVQVAGNPHASDQYAEVDLVNLTSTSTRNIGLGLRMQTPTPGTENMYRVIVSPDGSNTGTAVIEIAKYVSGASTSLAIGTTTFEVGTGAANKRLRAQVIGYEIKGFIDGVEVASAVDPDQSFASGQPGLHGFQPSNIDLDNWESGDITTGTAPTVTAPASVTPGATVSHSITNFGGALTTATLSDGTSTVSLGSVTDTQAQMPALGNNIQYTTFGADRTYTVGDGTDTANDTTDLDPPAGYALVTLGATFNTDEPSWLYQWGGTPVTGTQAVYPTADGLELYDDGAWYSPDAGSWTVYVIDPSDGIMQSFPLTAGDPLSPSVGGKMTRRNVTLRALTRRSLTARP